MNQTLEVEAIPTNAMAVSEPHELPTAKTDAAQARVEHVASVLAAAYNKASTLVLTAEESAKLLAEFPDAAVQRGAGGDPNLLYIAHAWVRERMLEVFGVGQWSLISRRTWLDEREGFMYVDCVLVCRGCYVGEAIGAQRYTPNNKRMNYSDAAEGAQSEALRRIAGKYLGCGIQVWKASYCEAWKARQSGAGGGARAMDAPSHRTGTTVKPMLAASESARPSPTTESRAKMIAQLKAGPGEPNRDMTTEYFRKIGAILDTEELEEMPLRFVPGTVAQMNALNQAIIAFEAGTDASPAFEPNPEPEPEKPARKAKEPELGIKDTRKRLEGVIQQVSEKPGSKGGKSWVKVGVKIGEEWLNSFDTRLAEFAKGLKETGETAVAFYQDGKFGKDLIELQDEAGNSSAEGEE